LLPTDPVEAIEESIHGIGLYLKSLIGGLLVLLRIKTEDL
jgi:hypothetical protein